MTFHLVPKPDSSVIACSFSSVRSFLSNDITERCRFSLSLSLPTYPICQPHVSWSSRKGRWVRQRPPDLCLAWGQTLGRSELSARGSRQWDIPRPTPVAAHRCSGAQVHWTSSAHSRLAHIQAESTAQCRRLQVPAERDEIAVPAGVRRSLCRLGRFVREQFQHRLRLARAAIRSFVSNESSSG